MTFSTNFQSSVFKALAITGILGLAIQPTIAQQNEVPEAKIEIVNQDGERVKSVEITGQAGGVVADGGAAVGGGAIAIRKQDGKLFVTDSDGNEKELNIDGAASISVSQGSETVVVDGERKQKSFGKAIIVDSNGQRHEIELDDPGAMGQLNIPGFRGSILAKRVGSKYMIGVHCQPVSKPLASQLNLDADTGLVVVSIGNDTPAVEAGIEKHDILMFADDKQLSKLSDLNEAVETAGKEETKISLTLIREGKEIGVDVSPAQRPEGPAGFNNGRMMLSVFPELRMRQALPGVIIGKANPILGPPHFDHQDLRKQMQEQMDEMMQQMDELRARQSEFLKEMEGLEDNNQ